MLGFENSVTQSRNWIWIERVKNVIALYNIKSQKKYSNPNKENANLIKYKNQRSWLTLKQIQKERKRKKKKKTHTFQIENIPYTHSIQH